jgi:hypothetical protein
MDQKTSGKSTGDKSDVIIMRVGGVDYEFEQFVRPQSRRSKKADAK